MKQANKEDGVRLVSEGRRGFSLEVEATKNGGGANEEWGGAHSNMMSYWCGDGGKKSRMAICDAEMIWMKTECCNCSQKEADVRVRNLWVSSLEDIWTVQDQKRMKLSEKEDRWRLVSERWNLKRIKFESWSRQRKDVEISRVIG